MEYIAIMTREPDFISDIVLASLSCQLDGIDIMTETNLLSNIKFKLKRAQIK